MPPLMAGVPPMSGFGSMIGQRMPTTPDELLREQQTQQQAQSGQSGVSILMDLIRSLMEMGDYEGLAKVLPQMNPQVGTEEMGAPPGPVLPAPEEELEGGYGGEMEQGEIGEYGGLLPEELAGLTGQAPLGGGSFPQYPLEEGPNVGQYNNPSVTELPGLLAGDAGFAPAPPLPQDPGMFGGAAGLLGGDAGFAPAPPDPGLLGPGFAPPDMRTPGPQPELPPWILELLGLQPGMQGQM